VKSSDLESSSCLFLPFQNPIATKRREGAYILRCLVVLIRVRELLGRGLLCTSCRWAVSCGSCGSKRPCCGCAMCPLSLRSKDFRTRNILALLLVPTPLFCQCLVLPLRVLKNQCLSNVSLCDRLLSALYHVNGPHFNVHPNTWRP
jgi:hypothetical protein